jgi:hypothetical protein
MKFANLQQKKNLQKKKKLQIWNLQILFVLYLHHIWAESGAFSRA